MGQGSCQVIFLGNQRAIVIDAGVSPELPLRLLKLNHIQHIDLLVVSHSHSDHDGGVATNRRSKSKSDPISGVLVAYKNAIGKVAYVFDSAFKERAVGRYLVSLLKSKELKNDQCIPIVSSSRPEPLWISDDGQTVLAALAPLGGQSLLEHEACNPNQSSAILELRHAGKKIVFASDSEYAQWRDLYRIRNNKQLECEVLTMPHHGGLMHGSSTDLNWFAQQAVGAKVVVVSVATRNQHSHPRPEVIRSFASQGCHVMCTQITEQCCGNLESVRPAVIGSLNYPCRSSSRQVKLGKKSKRSAHVACAGTIAAMLHDTGIEVEGLLQHRAGVDRLSSHGHSPCCR